MDTPGIDVRPLRTIQGDSEFAEMYLDSVRIPVSNLVGKENDGWRVAMVTFSFERGTAFVREMLDAMSLVRELAAIAATLERGSGTAWDDAGLRRDIGTVAADLDALWALTKRNVTRASVGGSGVPVGGGSAFKLSYSDARHHLTEVTMRVLDVFGISQDDLPPMAGLDGAFGTSGLLIGRQVRSSIHALAISIAAGTSQIQRNILAERVLGLPRER
jgi:alkylation response protein AidB-like acyl-CoA dehydrogenase